MEKPISGRSWNGWTAARRPRVAVERITHNLLDPVDFIACLAALVPPPQMHLTRFRGVLAPRGALRAAAIANFSQASGFIQALKELGCKFALGDFGTGLSSFGYLKHFPVDFLKIDGSFVKGVPHDPIDREMVRSINEIGHLTGKQTIAAWAENAEIIEVLRGLGIDCAQGYGSLRGSRTRS